MRRVLHIIDSLDDEGACSQLQLLARRTASEGLDIRIAELQPKKPQELHCGSLCPTRGLNPLPRVSLRRRAKFDPLAFIRLVRLVRQFEPEAIHSWTWDS